LKQILFICIFNMHRSVAAEYIFRNILANRETDYTKIIDVFSAGLFGEKTSRWFQMKGIPLPEPLFSRPPSEQVQAVLLTRGIDISHHCSKPVNRVMLDRSDMIVPLLPILKEDLISLYPETEKKVFLPRELLGEDSNFYWEETSFVPTDRRFWDFVHHDTDYVRTVVSEVEQFLQRASPEILSRLLGSGEKATTT